MGWRRILSRECPFNILSCAVTFSINRCHNKGMPLLPNHNSTLVNRPQDRRHLKLWHEYPSTRLILPISERGGAAWGACSKNPRGHLSNTSRCKSEGEEHQLWNEDNWTVLQKEQIQAELLPSLLTTTMQMTSGGRHWQHLKGNEQNSPLEGKKRKEIFEKKWII